MKTVNLVSVRQYVHWFTIISFSIALLYALLLRHLLTRSDFKMKLSISLFPYKSFFAIAFLISRKLRWDLDNKEEVILLLLLRSNSFRLRLFRITISNLLIRAEQLWQWFFCVSCAFHLGFSIPSSLFSLNLVPSINAITSGKANESFICACLYFKNDNDSS